MNENGLYELFNTESGKSVEVDKDGDQQCDDDEDSICMIVPAYLAPEIQESIEDSSKSIG